MKVVTYEGSLRKGIEEGVKVEEGERHSVGGEVKESLTRTFV